MMTTSKDELTKLAELSCIEIDSSSTSQMTEDLNAIMNFVGQLRQVNTSNVAPLLHPLHIHQRLRTDAVNEEDHRRQLATLTPAFSDDLFLVPKLGPFS